MTAAGLTPPGPDARPRLLVVDDQPANAQVLYRAFAADHRIFLATSGEQALTLCADKMPDLVLLDVVMPGMDGYSVCEHLKADAATRDIPVIFVTAEHDERAETRGLDVGAVDFITKPINPAVVRARVRTHLTLKRQSDLLRAWVYIDGLTSVCNRRLFDERLAVEWARAQRQRSPLSVALVDVDHFKRYNDHYGHQAGDACLRQVAGHLKTGLMRPADLVARYGGEEFVCLLPDTPADGAMKVLRNLGRRVFDAAIEHAYSDVQPVVTVSAGVATWTPGGEMPVGDVATLMGMADARLYRAKAAGRNQVCGA